MYLSTPRIRSAAGGQSEGIYLVMRTRAKGSFEAEP
jgi:hypothetical protein